ncbi:DUF7738 domain-containing protein [Neptunitalea lumnitzerae]|uniref:DUF7738 domain-containing protein n=1 Tax=Neptunitalea lumnitzerae TaxID=2965509 RepID=A0ABQ5MER1_9FLAO|nr:hypothetical protein [Neptunitalea sp. Y10]GLB47853.1 hypothetical protein Y10_02210 [Neptunitalea sp. Y10]
MSILKKSFPISILFFCCFTLTAFAQTKSHTIVYSEEGFTIDGVVINSGKTVKQVERILGVEGRKQKFAGNAYAHVYDELGITLFSNNKKIESLTINLVTGLEEGAPDKAYTGTFKINDVTISKTTTRENIYALKNIDMHCPGTSFCEIQMYRNPATAMIGFTKEGTVSVINFIFTHIHASHK